MKQFRFKLQAVLEYRAEQVNLVQQKVAEAEKQRQEIAARLKEYDAAIEQAFADQQRALGEPVIDPLRMQNFPGYLWRLRQFRFMEFQLLQQQDQKLRAIREELKQALIKRKSLEVLKDKEYAKYRKRIEKEEEAFLAEIALNRLTRRMVQTR